MKDTTGKPDFTLIPTQIFYEIEKVRQYGIKKYKDPENWKTVPGIDYRKALYRHVIKLMGGEEIDESGLKTLSHIACNVAFILELEKEVK